MMTRFQKLSQKGKIVAVTILVLAASGVVLGAVRLARRGPTVPTTAVIRGEFLDSMQFRGEVKAMKSVAISAPSEAGDLRIVKIATDGTSVKAGDVVVDFDKTKTEQELKQFRSALKSAEAEIDQAKALARILQEGDQTEVLKARYEVESAKLEAGKQEIVSRIEGEEAKLKLADSEQKLKEAESKEKSDERLNKSSVASKEESSRKAKYDVERAEHSLEQMALRAPAAGTLSLLQHFSRTGMSVFRAGDQAWPGAPIAALPDAASLRVSARVDETERGRLTETQGVTVQLNAIPDRQFTGHIEQISAIASVDLSAGWSMTRNFTLEIILDQMDPRFKMGLTGDVTVVVDKVANATMIPAQALFQRSGQTVAYVWSSGQFEERSIEVGRRSGDKVLVAKGVTAGEQVALRDPSLKE